VSRKIKGVHFHQNQIGTLLRHSVLFQHRKDTLMVLGGGYPNRLEKAHLKHCLCVCQIVPISESQTATHMPQNLPLEYAKIPLQGVDVWVLNSHGPQNE
jgi:hypothetical protein